MAKKCFWNPRTEDFSCFSWCVRPTWRRFTSCRVVGPRAPAGSRTTSSTACTRSPYSKQAKRELEDFGLNWSCCRIRARGACVGPTSRSLRGPTPASSTSMCGTGVATRSPARATSSIFERHLVRDGVHLLRLDAHHILINNISAFFSNQGRALDGTRSRVRHVCHRCRCGFRPAEPCSFDIVFAHRFCACRTSRNTSTWSGTSRASRRSSARSSSKATRRPSQPWCGRGHFSYASFRCPSEAGNRPTCGRSRRFGLMKPTRPSSKPLKPRRSPF